MAQSGDDRNRPKVDFVAPANSVIVRSMHDGGRVMNNIQFIDGAENCAYDVFSCQERDFSLAFPANGQDVEFIEDLIDRLGERLAGELISRISSGPIRKSAVQGIDGTIFFGLGYKRKYYPNKRESDLNSSGRGWVHG
jgi:hypothetical protein